MPWKNEKDPYKIWLSEVILQQTRVGQGLAYYENFVAKYPTVIKLAAAKEDEVMKMWEGLGYYSRCRNLMATAKFVAKDLDGIFPMEHKEILALKGIGPYTAAAIASFAYGLPFAVVDGNVNRVLARFFGIPTPIDTTDGKKEYQALAQTLLPISEPAAFNQAIMDFGATVCKPALPLCTVCPMAANCFAYTTGRVSELPIKSKKILKKDRWFTYLVFKHKKNIFITKRKENDIWKDLFEFYLLEQKKQPTKKQIEFLAKSPMVGKRVSMEFKQALTHQTLHCIFIEIELAEAPKLPEHFIKATASSIKKHPFPKAIRSFIDSQILN